MDTSPAHIVCSNRLDTAWEVLFLGTGGGNDQRDEKRYQGRFGYSDMWPLEERLLLPSEAHIRLALRKRRRVW